MGVYLGQGVYNESQVTPEWVEEEIAKNGKGVFFATHGQTTFQNILQEYNKGKIIVCKYEPVTPGEVTTYYFNLVRFNTETFDFVGVMQDGTIYRTGINSSEGWENVTTFKHDEIEFVEYDVDSYSTIKSYYDYGKFVVLKYQQPTPLVTKYYFYPLVSVDETNKEIVFGSLQLGQNNKKVTFTVTDSTGWAAPSESPAVIVDAALDSSSHNPVENMAIAAELTAINNKITGDLNDIFLALASKGVTVPTGAGLDDVAGLIDDISTGGVYPIPDNWVRVTGIKSKSRNKSFSLDISTLGLTNEFLKSEMLVDIEPITAKPFGQIPYEVPSLSLFCTTNILFYIWNGSNTLRLDFENRGGGGSANDERIVSGNTYGGTKTCLIYRNSVTIGEQSYLFDPAYYSIVPINKIYLWGPFDNDIFTYLTIYEATLKNNDDVVCHILPVMNTVNGHPGFFDEVSGRLMTFELSDSQYQDFEIIP